MATDIQEVGQRLREALELHADGPRTITWLHERMVKAEVPGSGYSNIQRYVAGKKGSPPSLEWLEGAAKVLRVRAAWLAFGEAPMSATKGFKAHMIRDPEWADPVRVASMGPSALSYGIAEELMVVLIDRLVDAQPADAPELSDADVTRLTERLSDILESTIGAFRKAGSPAEYTPFFATSLAALLTAVPEPRRGRTFEEILTRLPDPQPYEDDNEID